MTSSRFQIPKQQQVQPVSSNTSLKLDQHQAAGRRWEGDTWISLLRRRSQGWSRNLPPPRTLSSADVRGGGKLRDELEECLRGRLHLHMIWVDMCPPGFHSWKFALKVVPHSKVAQFSIPCSRNVVNFTSPLF